MKTYIGNDRCTRCHGGSSPCPVCSPVEETRRELKLAFDLPLSKQLRGRVSKDDGVMLDQMNEACKVLRDGGFLPRDIRNIEKHIVGRAKVFIYRHTKS